MFCCFCIFIFLFILYKVIDRLIRIPLIGNYNDRYILVTGCDTGFGNMFAKRLDERGCHVFAGCLTEKGETELTKSCSDRLHAIHLDVSKPESVRKALDFVKSHLPAGRGLWGVMNNAGILTKFGPPDWMAVDDYIQTNNVNLLGLIDVTMTFLPLVKTEHGRVVCTSSVFGLVSFTNSLPYNVSKYGVEAFVDGLRRSLIAFGCKAILVEPGIHATPLASADNVVSCYKRAWGEITPEVRAEYGEDFFNYLIGKGREKFLSNTSHKVSDVIDAYENAFLSRYPRARYLPGKDAKFFWLPLSYLPACMSDWILAKSDPDCPVPEAVRNR